MERNSLKILFIGNSFAVDTMEHTVNIALSLGFEKVRFATLYVGGCSIGMHYEHAKTDAPVYAYFENTGAGWVETPNYKISDAVKSDEWDFIAIQHGTSGTSRYTSVECYEKLNPLIDLVNEWAKYPHKIAFNLTWLGESTYQHHEIISYGGNTALMREKLVEVTKEVVVGNEKIDLLIPTGTAIENARTSNIGVLTRDCYHLSMDKGRFIAGLTLVSTVTG
ncbi:MAG: DUF4886 domain-containing protein, partial [Clostridia bacterium]|nr:DUF4886 domain-containing protein [Clostridia bacterium]